MSADINPAPTSPRSKLELLYRDFLQESLQLATGMEQLTERQEQIQQGLQGLPGAIRQAGVEAAAQAADQAGRALLETSRTLATCERDLRIAVRTVNNTVPSVAWRVGLLCAASAFFGGALSAAIVTLVVSP